MLLLAKTVSTTYRLLIMDWIPGQIEQDDAARGGNIEPKAARLQSVNPGMYYLA